MKITVKQQDLAKGLSVVSHAISSRSTLPILANILLTTDTGRLKLSATNLEIGINCWIDAEVQEEGTSTVPAKTISDLVGSLRPTQVEISTDETHTINVKSQGTNATIKGMDPAEYPVIPSLRESDTCMSFDARHLKEVLAMTTIAAADDDSRPVLAAVNIDVAVDDTNQEVVTFAAADAFRLAVLSTTEHTGASLPDAVLVPAKSLEQLRSILPNEGIVQVSVTRSQVLFHTENVDMVSRLIEGTFPNFRGIIPKEYTTRAVIDTKEFAAAVKTVTPFARDSSNIARIKLSSGGADLEAGSLTIEANAEDIGSNVSTINAAVEGPDQEIIFNVKYLSDVLGVLTTPEVALEVTSSARPGALKPVGSNQDYTYIIMPMSTNR